MAARAATCLRRINQKSLRRNRWSEQNNFALAHAMRFGPRRDAAADLGTPRREVVVGFSRVSREARAPRVWSAVDVAKASRGQVEVRSPRAPSLHCFHPRDYNHRLTWGVRRALIRLDARVVLRVHSLHAHMVGLVIIGEFREQPKLPPGSDRLAGS